MNLLSLRLPAMLGWISLPRRRSIGPLHGRWSTTYGPDDQPQAVASGGAMESVYSIAGCRLRPAIGRRPRFVFTTAPEIVLKTHWPGRPPSPCTGDGWAKPWDVRRSDSHAAEVIVLGARILGKAGPSLPRPQNDRLRGRTAALSIGISTRNLEEPARAGPAPSGSHPFLSYANAIPNFLPHGHVW